jgi:DNA mismatch repair ATPase MutL
LCTHLIEQADKKFILMRCGSTLLAADQHAVHERILLEHLLSRVNRERHRRMKSMMITNQDNLSVMTNHDLDHKMPLDSLCNVEEATPSANQFYDRDLLVSM